MAIKVLIGRNKAAYAELPEQERIRFDLGLSKRVFAFTAFYKKEEETSSTPETTSASEAKTTKSSKEEKEPEAFSPEYLYAW